MLITNMFPSLSAPSGLVRLLAVFTILLSLVWSLPTTDTPGPQGSGSKPLVADAPAVRKRAAPDFYLRILPLGASIVWGMGSTHNNG